MKKIMLALLFGGSTCFAYSQNVGIGTATPAEKLDVNGNINLKGQLKVNLDSGQANQVLMKNGSNVLVWANMDDYRNWVQYECASIATTANASNCPKTFAVPAGITKIWFEGWAGGGGGGLGSGGGGGGYISAIIDVVPASVIGFVVGAGGNYSSGVAAGITGGNTFLFTATNSYVAMGGTGGGVKDPQLSSTTSASPADGGTFNTDATKNVFGVNGQPGTTSVTTFVQVSTTEFGKWVHYGDGGDAALMPGSGAKGGVKFQSSGFVQNTFSPQQAPLPGGGGGADYSGGYTGHGGRVIIHY